MIKLLATVALAAAVASPALAQTSRTRAQAMPQARGAFAAETGPAFGFPDVRRRSPYDVYDTRGRYVGSDPDPTVRDQLARDPPPGD